MYFCIVQCNWNWWINVSKTRTNCDFFIDADQIFYVHIIWQIHNLNIPCPAGEIYGSSVKNKQNHFRLTRYYLVSSLFKKRNRHSYVTKLNTQWRVSPLSKGFGLVQWASYQIRKNAGCACAGSAGNVFPATDFKGNRKIVMPWYISRSLPSDGRENIPGIPGACATHNLAYLVRGPCWIHIHYTPRIMHTVSALWCFPVVK